MMEAFGLVCLYTLTAYDDLRERQVRVIEIIIFGIIGILINMFCKSHSLSSVFGGVAIGCLVLIFSYLSKEKIGKGDALLIIITGIYLGFRGTLTLLWISSILAAVVGTILVKKYQAKKDMELPFVPFLLMGYLLIISLEKLGGIAVCG
ncbi:prepilin peptidase [Pseudobutyrivibrio sp. 49]|uniref:prepilin peptidase n=1 Tax=Pseudobutyrivibrio sp. 49 TaxID=1855344 RepID=UPI000B7F6D5F|nr:A24 family peptidase [Pseudobutyrivibrio sp. 49]